MLSTLPDLHRSFAEQLKLKFQSDSRIHSLLAGGSIIHGGFDKYSDLDFVVVVDPLHYDYDFSAFIFSAISHSARLSLTSPSMPLTARVR